MQPIRVLPPGTAEVEECQFPQPDDVLGRLITAIDVRTLDVPGKQAMHEVRHAILDADPHVILTGQEIVDPFQQVVPHSQNALVAAIGGETGLLLPDEVTQEALDILMISDPACRLTGCKVLLNNR